MNIPILYSFRRCPYCMRAHMALKYSAIKTELREVNLQSLPESLLKISCQDTVPVLVIDKPDQQNNPITIMDESWDIVKWCLQQNDPEHWLGHDNKFLLDAEILVETNDYSFKTDLDHYKYADRHPEYSEEYYRNLCEEFIQELEDSLEQNLYLLDNKMTLADTAVFPFVRQFSLVDEQWFADAPYPQVRRWLNLLLDSKLFIDVFQKHENWKAGDEVTYV